MNELDFLLLFVILLGAAIGLRRGLIRMLISIVGIHFTVIVAGYAYKPMGQTLSQGFNLGRTKMFNFSYMLMVVFMTVAVELISRSFFEETRITTLRGLDNVLGGILGVLYGALWASLSLVPIQYGIAQTGGVWTQVVYQSSLVPTLNKIFRTTVLNVVDIIFIDGVPQLYLNRVSQKVSYLYPHLGSLYRFILTS